jgi:oligopeptide/dipeptide ABC transporter ATP-binding protein
VSDTLIAADQVRQTFGVGRSLLRRSRLVALDDVSLAIARNEMVALVGESGSGKTTLGRILVALQTPTAGRVLYGTADVATLRGADWRRYRRCAQVVFQDPAASLNPRRSAAAAIRTPLEGHLGLAGRAAAERADELLAAVGLDPPAFRDRLPHELSGGQRQRVAIARAIAPEPEFLVADEPVSALDVSVRAHVLRLLRRLQVERGLACLLITHDLGMARVMTDRLVVLYLGSIVEQGPTAQLMTRPGHPYTRSLLAASPVPDPRRRRRPSAVVAGEIPSPIDRPSGCRFHPRCAYAIDRCRVEEPKLRDPGDGRRVACHRVEDVLDGV